MNGINDGVKMQCPQLADHIAHGRPSKFLEDAVNLRFYRSDGDIPRLGNFSCLHALVEKLQHLEFAVGQPGQNREGIQKILLLCPNAFQLIYDFFRIGRAKDKLILAGVSDGGQNLGDGIGLDNVIRHTGTVGLKEEIIILKNGQDDNLCLRQEP